MAKKKSTQFFTWLNNAVFWKNMALTKTTYDEKRVILCYSHKKSKKRG